MKRPEQITLNLQKLKEPWLAWCKSKKLSPSEAMRLVIAKLLTTVEEPKLAFVEEATEKPSIRKVIGLTNSENLHVEEIAKREGYSANKWIVALIRTRLTKSPAFGQHELEVLSKSNGQLLAIGRNLNQIARALNTDDKARLLYRVDMIEALSDEIKNHTGQVSKIIAANMHRWEIK